MTDAQIQSLAEEYKRLETLVAREQSRPNMSMAAVRCAEDAMARIETKFQQADVDIRQWI